MNEDQNRKRLRIDRETKKIIMILIGNKNARQIKRREIK